MIVRIGKCEIPQEEFNDIVTQFRLKETFQSCKMTLGEKVVSQLEKTEWFGKSSDFNYFTNYEQTKNLCKGDGLCLWDAINRSLMETTKFTHEIYNFSTWYIEKAFDGITNEFEKFEIVLNFIIHLF